MGKELSLIAKGAGFYFLGFAVSKVLAYLYRALVARGLGPGEFGIFSLGETTAGIVLVFAALGLYQGIMHFTAFYEGKGQEAKTRGTIMVGLKAQLISSLLFGVALFLLSDYIAVSFFREPDVATVIKVLALALPFSVMNSSLMIIVVAFKKIEYKIYVRNILENVVKLGVTALLFYAGFRVFGAAIGLALSSVAAFALAFYLIQKKLFPLLGKGLKAEPNTRELLNYSWPLLAVGFFDVLMRSIDTIMLGHLSRAYDAGLYNVAEPTANLLLIAPFAFGTLFLPIITGMYAQKKMDEMHKTLKVVTRWTYAMIFPCLLFTALFAREILAVMFGDVYAQGASTLVILSVGIFMVSLLGQSRSVLESTRRTKLIFLNTVLAGLTNVVLNLWLIPLFALSGAAIVGAALATAVSYFLWNFLAFAEVFVLTRMHPYSRAYFPPTVASVAAIALFFLVKSAIPDVSGLSFPLDFIGLAALGSSFLAFYGLLFIMLRGLQKEDLEMLKAFERKSGIRVNLVREFVKRFS